MTPQTRRAAVYRALYVLVLVASFLLGRAYGWYEADRFMAGVAKRLGVVVVEKK